MRRTVLTWAIFAAALLLVLAAMALGTSKMLQLERTVADNQAAAATEENVRLALWRMDSAAAALLAPKSHPPAFFNETQSGNVAQMRGDERFTPINQMALSKNELRQRDAFVQAPPADWHRIEPVLLDRISDILPGATLEPVNNPAGNPDDLRRLASIPARLVVPASATRRPALPWNTPLRLSLIVAWSCAAVGAIAVAILLAGALALSERRAAFVSTVTHELRTPLTTFKMYAEMLATGIVTESKAREEYLQTLVSESDRLARLIENVLAYARLERRVPPSRAQAMGAGELLDRSLLALRRRAEHAKLDLRINLQDELAKATCRTDPLAVQQILVNLVDNACKYGRTDIDIAVRLNGRQLECRVCDRGPGLQIDSKRLFQPFSKSKSDAIPGIGLGLFLSRRLARDLGGDLEYRSAEPGATFILTLPICMD